LRKKKPPEHVNHERWLVSYADFITLLFAFFTTLYAISTVDAQKMGKMVLSMRASFDGSVFSPGSDTLSLSKGDGAGSALSRDLVENVKVPKDKALKEYAISNLKELKTNFVENPLPKGEVVAMGKLRDNVDVVVKKRGVTGKVKNRMETRGLVISLDGSFFDSGSDQLVPKGYELLDALAEDLIAMKTQIRIEGHTDNVPIKTVRFPSNWELSTARATTIVAYLIQKYGFKPESLSGTGFAEFCPIAPNDTAEGRAHNRRVDIVVLNSTYSRSNPRQTEPSPKQP
jgi:chemotaxis protein MotB